MQTTRNTLPDNTRNTAIDVLQARLADTLDLASHMKQAHWTVRGPNFIALHELFDKIHGETLTHADMIAERLAALGGQPHGTTSVVGKNSVLNAYPLNARNADEHIHVLCGSVTTYSTHIRRASDDVSQAGDEATADLFIEILRQAETSLWFLEAHQSN